jgi:hypothetical protein
MLGDVDEFKAEDWGKVTTLRAFYQGGLEVEYNFSAPDWADVPVDAGTRRVVSDGMRILFDLQGILKRLQEAVSART